MRQRSRSTHGTVVAYVALFIALGGTTYAATGGNFLLGKPNSASSTSSLSTPVNGKALQLTNTSTGTGATALGLNVASGHAPFTVNSGTKVANLNADKLDGIDSTGFKSDAYIDSQDATQALDGQSFTQVASKTLPAGSFILMAKLLADNDDTDVNRVVCTLNDPATNQIDRMDLRLGPTGFNSVEFGNISLIGAVTLSVPGTVTMNCIETEAPSPAVTVSLRKLIAIKVDTLHP